jgi:hypothetical protein
MANNVEMKAHDGTYVGFISMLKWGIAVVAIVTIVVVMLIAG